MSTLNDWTEVRGSETVYWEYPQIYADAPLDELCLSLSHVRAANPIYIKFDGGRSGWVISAIPDGSVDGQKREMAFIPAFVEVCEGCGRTLGELPHSCRASDITARMR